MKIHSGIEIMACLFVIILALAGGLFKQSLTISRQVSTIAKLNNKIEEMNAEFAAIEDEFKKVREKKFDLEDELNEGQRLDDEFLNTNYYLSTNGIVKVGMTATELAEVLGTNPCFFHRQFLINYPEQTNHESGFMLGWPIFTTPDKHIHPFETCFIFLKKRHPANESPGFPMSHNPDYTDNRWIVRNISLKYKNKK